MLVEIVIVVGDVNLPKAKRFDRVERSGKKAISNVAMAVFVSNRIESNKIYIFIRWKNFTLIFQIHAHKRKPTFQPQ